MKSSASTTSGKSSPGNSEPEPWPQTHAHEDGIELLLDLLGGNVPANLNAAPELDSQALNEFYLLQADLRYHLIVGDAIGVEPAGLGLLLKDHDLMPELRQFRRAAKPCRPSADHAPRASPIFLAGGFKMGSPFRCA